MNYVIVYNSNYLSHHGILGQKWGVRNGPPYPLSSGDHSASENKAGWRKSLEGGVHVSGKTGAKHDYSKDLTDKELAKYSVSQPYSLAKAVTTVALDKAAEAAAQRIIETTASQAVQAIAGPLATIAARTAVEAGEHAIDKILTKNEKKKLDELRKNETIDPKTGLHLKSKNDKSNDIMEVNPKFHDDSKGFGATSNCVRCTFAYDLRKRGYDVSAGLSLSGVRGLATTKSLYKNVVNVKGKSRPLSVFSNEGNITLGKDMLSKLKSEPDSRGQILLQWPFGGGHSMAYEVKNGTLNIIDSQIGHRYSEKESLDILCSGTKGSYQRLDNLEINENRAKRYVI